MIVHPPPPVALLQAQAAMVCDALGRTTLPAPRVERRADLDFLLGPLPATAYRLLLDFLWSDRGWAHYTTPVFSPGGWVTVYLNGAEERHGRREEGEAGRRGNWGGDAVSCASKDPSSSSCPCSSGSRCPRRS